MAAGDVNIDGFDSCKTDVTPAILSRDFPAQLYRAIKLRDQNRAIKSQV